MEPRLSGVQLQVRRGGWRVQTMGRGRWHRSGIEALTPEHVPRHLICCLGLQGRLLSIHRGEGRGEGGGDSAL
eukprot:360178-Chlamydomonas_euryale.AAC.1